jgi:hypothetical protein
MFYEPGHPIVAKNDWQRFFENYSPFYFSAVIERQETSLPAWFLPFARGCAVLSQNLLLKARYHTGVNSAYGCDILPHFPNGFSARRFGDLWFLLRDGFPEDALAFCFGSTPVATRHYESAMCFIWHFRQHSSPECFTWVRTMPTNCAAAIELARKLRANEAYLQGK